MIYVNFHAPQTTGITYPFFVVHSSPMTRLAPITSTQPTPKILIVDDEPHVRKFLRLSLQTENFNVLEATTAEEAVALVYEAQPDLMILDLGLPDIDGRQVIRDVRMTSIMPILVLTGRTEDSEKIAALEQGADDYITKPFAVRDLVARVRAALSQQALRHSQTSGRIQTGDISIHMTTSVVHRAGKHVPLSDEEFALLCLLAQHGGRVMTYNRLTRALWGDDEVAGTGHTVLQKRINALRYKLEDEPSFPRYIVTESAIGYRLEMLPPEEQ